MSSANQGDRFIEVTPGSKKRKSRNPPTLPRQPKSGSSEPPLEPQVRLKPYRKKTIPAIISGVDEKFKSWRKLMGELRPYHPSLKILRIKELPKGGLVVIGDSMQNLNISQNESKMKAALGKNVKICLPKAFQTSKDQTKSLSVKGVPTDMTDIKFKGFLDLNKISYAKAERLKSKKDGRVLPMFQLEINDPTEAETLISQNLVCQVTSIVYEMEEFRSPVSVTQCYNCQTFGHSAKNCRSKQK